MEKSGLVKKIWREQEMMQGEKTGDNEERTRSPERKIGDDSKKEKKKKGRKLGKEKSEK